MNHFQFHNSVLVDKKKMATTQPSRTLQKYSLLRAWKMSQLVRYKLHYRYWIK